MTEDIRHRIHNRLDELMGTEEATALMEAFPPTGWADVATNADLEHLQTVLRQEIRSSAAETRNRDERPAHRMSVLRGDLRTEMSVLRGDLRTEMSDLDARLCSKMSDLDRDLRSEMTGLRDDLRSEMTNLRDELRTDMTGLRDDLRSEMTNLRDELRTEMIGLRDELRTDMTGLRDEHHKDSVSLRVEIGNVRSDLLRDQRNLVFSFIGANAAIAALAVTVQQLLG
ncbi:MAG: CCDC90 family protein [Microthrixaceae bacterium]|nr:CCDC90 family protein [Microthrixaceae bacterium]